MTANEIIIYCCGLYSLAFAIFHTLFWKLFNWRSDLKKLSFANRAIIQIANTRLIYIFLFVAFVCFFYSEALQSSALGHVFLAGISVFWLGRMIEQFVFLQVSNKMVNILTVIFAIGTILFAHPLFI